MKDQYMKDVIDPGDSASQLAKEVCFQSHQNCPALNVIPHESGNFRGPVGYLWKEHILEQMLEGYSKHSWIMLEEAENDGAGGKPQFFTLIGTKKVFSNLGWEIITMTADDFARSGRLPCVIINELNAKQITENNFSLFQATMEGYGKALKEAQLVNITGETAVMKHSITAFCDRNIDEQFILTWGATCIGLSHQDLLIDNSMIKSGMPIVGFRELGYRCNGGTFFTNLILEKWGSPQRPEFWESKEMIDFVEKLTVPSKSYAKTINRIIGWNLDGSIGEPMANITGIAHITGGGVWGKFGEILPDNIGAILNSMPAPTPVLLTAQDISWDTKHYLTDWQAHSTLHGGCGMLLVANSLLDAETIIKEAEKDGIQAQIVGETITSHNQQVIIESRFLERKTLYSGKPE